jgi:hypothetical protein
VITLLRRQGGSIPVGLLAGGSGRWPDCPDCTKARFTRSGIRAWQSRCTDRSDHRLPLREAVIGPPSLTFERSLREVDWKFSVSPPFHVEDIALVGF